MKRLKIFILLLTVFSSLALLMSAKVLAVDPLIDACTGSGSSSAVCQDRQAAAGGTKTDNAITHTIKVAADIIAAITGVIAVVMIMVGGFTYITSGGSPEKLTTARNRITYSLMGLAIVALAWAIIRFVIDNFIIG